MPPKHDADHPTFILHPPCSLLEERCNWHLRDPACLLEIEERMRGPWSNKLSSFFPPLSIHPATPLGSGMNSRLSVKLQYSKCDLETSRNQEEAGPFGWPWFVTRKMEKPRLPRNNWFYQLHRKSALLYTSFSLDVEFGVVLEMILDIC